MEEMIDVYHANHPLYEDFTNQMQQFMSALLQKENIRVHSVVSRVKTAASLRQKIVSHDKYTQLEGITDLCGLRIITYFEDDVDLIGSLINEKFVIDQQNSIDKRKLLAPNQFGYLSLHLVAGLPAGVLQIPQYMKFKNCKIEIQICSILQHAWAEIEHDLGYKTSTALSYSARRRFSRLAGLLEIADGEFRQLRDELQPDLTAKPGIEAGLSLTSNVLPQINQNLFQRKIVGFKNKALQFRAALNEYLQVDKAKQPFLDAFLMGFAVSFAVNLPHILTSLLLALNTEKHTIVALATYYLHV